MTHSNVDDADISCIAEKQHPQNAFTGRAKDVIQDYNGELYREAIEKW